MSIRSGDSASYGSSFSSLRRARIAFMSSGLVPVSMTDETNAANPGGAQPLLSKRSACTKVRPLKACFGLLIGPCMCTPHAVQALRWMVFVGSTTLSLWPLATTLTFGVGTTAIIENSVPEGLQHCEQPQTWLNSTSPSMDTFTGSVVHLHVNVPPANPGVPALTPLSTAG